MMRRVSLVAAVASRRARSARRLSTALSDAGGFARVGPGQAIDTATTAEVLAADQRRLWHPYTSATNPLPCLAVERASGVTLTLEDGRTLVDGMSSWWCAVHGYAVPELDAAAAAQLRRMSHVMFGGLTHRPAVALGELLASIAPPPLQRVFLCDSGSVAVEVAIKMALQYHRAQGVHGRTRLLTVRGGYHGDTFGAMGVCDPVNGMHAEMFGGALPTHLFAPRPAPAFGTPCADADVAELAALLAAHGDEVAALILEPIVQGAGGMRLYSADYLRRARALCDAHGVLLIADEIATGFGRTGRLFACEHAGVAPDILCVGKALTGGYMTMGATLATDAVAEGVSGGARGAANVGPHGIANPAVPLMHGPTFMGNPLACAVARASIELLLSDGYAGGDGWRRRVADLETQLGAQLAPLGASAAVSEVRVLGAIGVVEMDEPLHTPAVTALLAERGVWLRPFGRLLYTMPPFVISPAELRRVTEGMAAVVDAAERGQMRPP